MPEHAEAVANVLLRAGVLDPEDADQRALYEELMANPALYDEVKERLGAVGYELVQFYGHMGVRLGRRAELDAPFPLKDFPALHAGHVRLLVYLWVQLVYRQIKAAGRDEETEPLPGRAQVRLELFEDEPSDDEAPSIAFEEVATELCEQYSLSALRGWMTTLKRHRFVRQSGKAGRVSAGPALYVLIDPTRMEELVVGLARRGAAPLAEMEEAAEEAESDVDAEMADTATAPEAVEPEPKEPPAEGGDP